MIGTREDFVTDRRFRHHRLDEARPVAHDQEVQLSTRTTVVEPSVDRHFLTVVLGDVFDISAHRQNVISIFSRRSRAFTVRFSTSMALPESATSNSNTPS